MMISKKSDIRAYINQSPYFLESKSIFEEDEPGTFAEVEEELISLIAGSRGSPEFGEDWSHWLDENFKGLLQEAISIVV